MVGGHDEAATQLLLAGGYPSLWAGVRDRVSLRVKMRYALGAPASIDWALRSRFCTRVNVSFGSSGPGDREPAVLVVGKGE